MFHVSAVYFWFSYYYFTFTVHRSMHREHDFSIRVYKIQFILECRKIGWNKSFVNWRSRIKYLLEVDEPFYSPEKHVCVGSLCEQWTVNSEPCSHFVYIFRFIGCLICKQLRNVWFYYWSKICRENSTIFEAQSGCKLQFAINFSMVDKRSVYLGQWNCFVALLNPNVRKKEIFK